MILKIFNIFFIKLSVWAYKFILTMVDTLGKNETLFYSDDHNFIERRSLKKKFVSVISCVCVNDLPKYGKIEIVTLYFV